MITIYRSEHTGELFTTEEAVIQLHETYQGGRRVISPVTVYESLVERQKAKQAALRVNLLCRLTAEEKEALGLEVDK